MRSITNNIRTQEHYEVHTIQIATINLVRKMRAGCAIVVLTAALAIINKHTCLAFISDGDISSTRFTNKVPEIDPKTLQQYAEFAEFANTLADAARREILPYWRQNRSTLGHEIKVETGRSMFQSASPVTLADR